MSVPLRLIRNNRLAAATPKNGGAGAPAIDEDPAFPLANIQRTTRNRFWRSSNAPASPLDPFDYDLSSNQVIKVYGLARIRHFRGTAGITTFRLYSATGTYPPAGWTLRATQTVTTADNDLFWELSPTISARLWRFEFDNAGQFSCKPWLVTSGAGNIIDLREGFDLVESIRRIRPRETRTFLGNVIFNDLGVAPGDKIRRWVFRDIVTTAVRQQILTCQADAFILRDVYGAHYEASFADPLVAWGEAGYQFTTRQALEPIVLEQLP